MDIARVNSYILFQEWRKENPDIEELKRPNRYLQIDFTEELIRSLGGFEKTENVPNASNAINKKHMTTHQIVPDSTNLRRNCKLCAKSGKQKKSTIRCSTCDTYLCFNKTRNCLVDFHKV